MSKGMTDRPTFNKVGSRTLQESIKLDYEYVDAVRKIAERNGLTKSEIYREAIELYVSDNETIIDRRIKETTFIAKDLIDKMEHFGKIKEGYIEERRVKKVELKRERELEAENTVTSESQKVLNDMKRIQTHLNGGTSIWVSEIDPTIWMFGEVQPEETFRRLPKGELNPHLRDYYNDNIHLLK